MQLNQQGVPQGDEDPIMSPFSDVASQPRHERKKSRGLLITGGVLILAILAVGGFFLFQQLNDPLRTLEAFPVQKYLENFRSLEGSKFKAELRVENDLGWKEGVGRLMVFSVRGEPNPIVVLIPPSLAQTYFVKGQNYRGELEVKQGGLIHANSCKKN
jgi:hypothetical protein